jgi:hypothetical protein
MKLFKGRTIGAGISRKRFFKAREVTLKLSI